MTNLVILDASGSMSSMKDEAIGALVQLFITMRETKQIKRNLVVDFSGAGDIRTLVDSKNPEDLKEELAGNYKTRGMTALYDAIGYSFDLIPKREKKVFVTIITDGEENDSKKYDTEKIQKLIEAKKEKGWVIIFTGTTEKDAYKLGLKTSYRSFSSADSFGTMLGFSGYSGYSGKSGFSGYSGTAAYAITAYATLSNVTSDNVLHLAQAMQTANDNSSDTN